MSDWELAPLVDDYFREPQRGYAHEAAKLALKRKGPFLARELLDLRAENERLREALRLLSKTVSVEVPFLILYGTTGLTAENTMNVLLSANAEAIRTLKEPSDD